MREFEFYGYLVLKPGKLEFYGYFCVVAGKFGIGEQSHFTSVKMVKFHWWGSWFLSGEMLM